ncbi:PHP domain-containing protein [Patescibacteria group bacterium]|nr:PHP domain-containing protein [Patescibacteria group bacterium]MBU1703193.1 PHP domain-containing protein [Patescibacteria group bacterium]MBU1953523.1 PHP domain-containing protein [Patescibacteria group bacterium]
MPKLKAQLHIHTRQDPVDNIRHTERQKIDYAAKNGYDVMAITCHNVMIFNDDLKKYAEKKRILLIPGIEIGINRKHVLILNAGVEAQNIKSFADLRKYKEKNPKCMIIAVHPYFPGWVSLHKRFDENIDLFDAVEYSWFHSKRINRYNKKAIAAAEKHNLPILATSDNHLLRYFNNTYSFIEADKNIDSIFRAIKEKKVTFVSHDLTPWKMVCIVTEMWVRQLVKRFTLS